MAEPAPLSQQIATFDRLLPELRRARGDVWAVVSAERLEDAFGTFEQAASYAVERGLLGDVLIRHTNARRPTPPSSRWRNEPRARLFGPAAQGIEARAFEATVFGHFLPVVLRPPSLSHPAGLAAMAAVNGLVDTGASDVCLDVRLADELGPPTIDQAELGVVGSRVPASVRVGRLEVREVGFDEPVRLFAVRMRRPTHDVILGRAFLQRYVVTFDGPRGTMLFHNPAAELEEDPADG